MKTTGLFQISITGMFEKKIIFKQFNRYLLCGNLLGNPEFGFRTSSPTVDAIYFARNRLEKIQ